MEVAERSSTGNEESTIGMPEFYAALGWGFPLGTLGA